MNKFLALPLAASLLLASCGGGSTPTTTSPSTGAGDSLTSDGTATAARSFVLDRAAPLAAQSLNALSLRQQDTTSPEERLRISLNVERVKSGANIGQRRATARIIWAREGVKLSGPVTLTLFDRVNGQNIRQKKAALALNVVAPEFQAAKTFTTGSLTTGASLCARLSFGLSASSGVNFDNTAAPLEVCEGEDVFSTTIKTLSKAASKAQNTTETTALAPFKVVGFSGVRDMPDEATLRLMLGVPQGAIIKDETAESGLDPKNFAPTVFVKLTALYYFSKPEGNKEYLPLFGDPNVPIDPSKNVTSQGAYKRLHDNSRAKDALVNLMQTYALPLRAYYWDVSAGRREVALVGLTSGGVFAIRTTRFSDPALDNPFLWPLDTAALGWTAFYSNQLNVTVEHLRPFSDVDFAYSIRPALACGAAADGDNVRSGGEKITTPSISGLRLSADGVPTDDGLQVSYTINLSNQGARHTLSGSMCAGDGAPIDGGVTET